MSPLLALLTLLSSTSATVGVLNIPTLLSSTSDPLSALHAPTQDRPHAPWSHHPHCTSSRILTHLGQKFCIYTSNTTGPYGLSLVLKPQDAVRATEYLDDVPLQSFLTREEAEALYLGGEQPWKVVDMPGKDKGVIARRKIKQFETFMVDQAAVVVDMETEKALSRRENNKLLKLAVDRLRVPDMIRDMSAAHNDGKEKDESDEEQEKHGDGDEEGRLEEDIMKTNAFGSTVADINTRALFPLISRINHACNPNSFVMFSRAGVSMAIKAYRDIEEGEEITISSKKASDLRRVMIAQAEEKIIELAESYHLDAAISLTHESIAMILEEDIAPMLTDEYAMLAMLYLENGDRANADKYGRLAWGLLGDLGFLGVGQERMRQGFSLEKLLGNMGRLGGDGSGGKWKKGA